MTGVILQACIFPIISAKWLLQVTPSIVCSCSLLASSRIKGVDCVECKLLHCEYRASKGVDYQSMPLQCIVFFGSTYSQYAIEVIFVSNEADLRADSNDSSPMCISCKITKLFKLFLHRSEREHTIVCLACFSIVSVKSP